MHPLEFRQSVNFPSFFRQISFFPSNFRQNCHFNHIPILITQLLLRIACHVVISLASIFDFQFSTEVLSGINTNPQFLRHIIRSNSQCIFIEVALIKILPFKPIPYHHINTHPMLYIYKQVELRSKSVQAILQNFATLFQGHLLEKHPRLII